MDDLLKKMRELDKRSEKLLKDLKKTSNMAKNNSKKNK